MIKVVVLRSSPRETIFSPPLSHFKFSLFICVNFGFYSQISFVSFLRCFAENQSIALFCVRNVLVYDQFLHNSLKRHF